MPSDSDHMSADLPDDAIFSENKTEQEIMDVVVEPAHADQECECKPGVLPESIKEPEQEIMDVVVEPAHVDQECEYKPGVLPDSTKEPEPQPAHADQDSEGVFCLIPLRNQNQNQHMLIKTLKWCCTCEHGVVYLIPLRNQNQNQHMLIKTLKVNMVLCLIPLRNQNQHMLIKTLNVTMLKMKPSKAIHWCVIPMQP